MSDVKSTLTETLRAHQPDNSGFNCTGCNWEPTNPSVTDDAEFAAHQVDLLLELSGVAITPIRKPLPQPCVVDGCDFEWVTYDELNNHSEANHLEPNPFEAGGWRFPGADHVGDFTWHPVTVTVQRVVSEGETHPEDEQLRHVTNNPTHPRISGDPR